MVNEPVMRASLWRRIGLAELRRAAPDGRSAKKIAFIAAEYFAKEFATPTAVVSRVGELASTLTNVSARPTRRLIFFLAQATHAYSLLKRSINHILQG
jgi:hypothetical protein